VQRADERERWRADASLDELALLAETAGAEVVGRSLQRLAAPHPATYVGKGKLGRSRRGVTATAAIRWCCSMTSCRRRSR
jgi:GTP-binding protein HflX